MRKAMFHRLEEYIPELSENVTHKLYVVLSALEVSTL